MKHIRWFFFILGLSLGFIFGVYYAWEVSPIDPKDAAPSDLQTAFQDEYRSLIALSYASSDNIDRAERRLQLLPHPDPAQALSALAQKHLAEGRPQSEVLAAAHLAAALSKQPSSMETPQATRITRTPTATPTRTATALPSPTQTATPPPDFQLRSLRKICDPDLPPMIQVSISDSEGQPVSGMEIVVVWDDGEDHFFTGLKPDIGLGYGDFVMQEGTTYTLHFTGIGESLSDLQAAECEDEEEESYPGSWLLVFQEP
jgi:hypothetical protein